MAAFFFQSEHSNHMVVQDLTISNHLCFNQFTCFILSVALSYKYHKLVRVHNKRIYGNMWKSGPTDLPCVFFLSPTPVSRTNNDVVSHFKKMVTIFDFQMANQEEDSCARFGACIAFCRVLVLNGFQLLHYSKNFIQTDNNILSR